jgi:hypothetical protein
MTKIELTKLCYETKFNDKDIEIQNKGQRQKENYVLPNRFLNIFSEKSNYFKLIFSLNTLEIVRSSQESESESTASPRQCTECRVPEKVLGYQYVRGS